jgi:hypothetical protein
MRYPAFTAFTAIALFSMLGGVAGGIGKLMVPSHDADLPQPRLANGAPDPQFESTEAKRYLGKQLFHDPIRTARILPEFGGCSRPSRRRRVRAVTWGRRRRRPARC